MSTSLITTTAQSGKSKVAVSQFLSSRPCPNTAAERTSRPDGGTIVKVPMNRPGWLVPPLSWLLPFSENRRLRLDAIGTQVLQMCDGDRTVETIIEQFAVKNKLSFREAQLPVTQFLQQMTERGVIAIVGPQEKADQT